MTLHVVPPDGGGPVPDGAAPSGPAGPPSTTVSDGEALANRVALDRLASRLLFLGGPGDWLLPVLAGTDGVLVAVFDADAMPELAGLLLGRRP